MTKPITNPPGTCPICGKDCQWKFDGIQKWPKRLGIANQDQWTSLCCDGTVNIPRIERKG